VHGGGEGREIVGAQEKGARPADDVLVVVALQPRLARQDGEAVDGDAGGDELVAHLGDRRPDIGDAVAREIDEPAIGRIGRRVEQAARRLQRVADRRQPVGAALRRAHPGGEGGGARGVADARPADRHDLLVAIRPFEHRRLDGAVPPGADRGGDHRVLEGARDPVMLQDVFAGIDAFRDVDRHDEGEVDRLRGGAGGEAGDGQRGSEQQRGVDETPHGQPMRRYCGDFAASAALVGPSARWSARQAARPCPRGWNWPLA
jgi:hypothetical protein